MDMPGVRRIRAKSDVIGKPTVLVIPEAGCCQTQFPSRAVLASSKLKTALDDQKDAASRASRHSYGCQRRYFGKM